jgi:hypothetical protein
MHNRERVCFGVCVCGLIHVTLGWAEKVCHPPNAFSCSVCITIIIIIIIIISK